MADRVALAHTRDDQAETVLFRVLRGSGLTGLAGIRPVTKDGLVRPLLDVSRAEIVDFLHDRKSTWREDSSNRDQKFARNRIRGTLLPQLASEWNPRIADALAQLADLAWEEEQLWEADLGHRAAGAITPAASGSEAAGAVELNAEMVNRLPRALARRLIRRAIVQAKGNARRIEFDHVERILDLIAQERGAGALRFPGVQVHRSFDRIRFSQAPASVLREGPVRVQIPGACEAPDGITRIHFEIGETAARRRLQAKGIQPPCDTLRVELSWRKILEPVEVRGWQPGDHYRPLGEARDQKIKDLFQRSRVPSWSRRGWPIVTSGGKILWVRGFGAADGYAARGTEVVLRIWEAAARP